MKSTALQFQKWLLFQGKFSRQKNILSLQVNFIQKSERGCKNIATVASRPVIGFITVTFLHSLCLSKKESYKTERKL